MSNANRRWLHRLMAVALLLWSASALLHAITTTSFEAYWKLDAGAITTDSHGSNTLTNGTSVTTTTGKINDAADFEGSTPQWLTRGDNASLSTGDIDFTLGCWVNMESKTSEGMILGKDDAGSGEYWLLYHPGSNRFQFQTWGASGFASEGAAVADALGSPSLATWYHVVGWHDATANQVGIAVNAGTANTTSHSAGSFDGTGNFFIGKATFNQPFDGLIDECFFAKRVLSAGDRTDLYNAGNGLAYPFSAAAATPLRLLLGVGRPQ